MYFADIYFFVIVYYFSFAENAKSAANLNIEKICNKLTNRNPIGNTVSQIIKFQRGKNKTTVLFLFLIKRNTDCFVVKTLEIFLIKQSTYIIHYILN